MSTSDARSTASRPRPSTSKRKAATAERPRPIDAKGKLRAERLRVTVDPDPDKPRQKLVRESFTIPKAEYAVLGELKERAARLIRPVKKGELLRAGIFTLNAMPDEIFLATLSAIPSLKPGRPKSALPAASSADKRTKRRVKA